MSLYRLLLPENDHLIRRSPVGKRLWREKISKKSYPVMKTTKLVINREVHEVSVEKDGFTEDLDPGYISFLERSFTNDPNDARQLILEEPSSEENDSDDFPTHPDLYASTDDESNDTMTTLRAAIEERRKIQEAAEACYPENTPIGKHIRSFRYRYPPKP